MRMTDLMKKHVKAADIKAIEDAKNALADNSVRVTCIGLYNHGKSSLLNTLIRDLDDRTFKTKDVRETVEIQEERRQGRIFVDTPGLNANERDDSLVISAMSSSDINLFVHRVTTGELAEAEVKFLHIVKKSWGDAREFLDRTIFVLSAIDDLPGDESREVLSTSTRIAEQVREIFGVDCPRIVPVSSKRFRKGSKGGKGLLVERSNLSALEKEMNRIEAVRREAIKKTREDRLARLYARIVGDLQEKIAKKKQMLADLKKRYKKREDMLKADLRRINETLHNKQRELEEV